MRWIVKIWMSEKLWECDGRIVFFMREDVMDDVSSSADHELVVIPCRGNRWTTPPTPIPLSRKHNWRVSSPTSELVFNSITKLTPENRQAAVKADRPILTGPRRRLAHHPNSQLKGFSGVWGEIPRFGMASSEDEQMRMRIRCSELGMWLKSDEWFGSFSIGVFGCPFRWGDAGRSKENSVSPMWLWERDTTRVLQNKESVMLCAAK
jgi:hypothetical protein